MVDANRSLLAALASRQVGRARVVYAPGPGRQEGVNVRRGRWKGALPAKEHSGLLQLCDAQTGGDKRQDGHAEQTAKGNPKEREEREGHVRRRLTLAGARRLYWCLGRCSKVPEGFRRLLFLSHGYYFYPIPRL